MQFEDLNLNRPLLNALADIGFTHPTTIQKKIFSVIMSGKDVIGIAQTGTGKTFAYLLPALRQWTYSKDKQAQILIVVPTRELVIQVVEQVKLLTPYMSVIVTGVFGGVNLRPQAMEVENGVDVLVATPGRLLDLLLNGHLKTKSLKKLIIDEVDEMLNLGFRSQLIRIMELLPPKRQNLMFSATLTDDVELLINEYFRGPEKVEAAPAGTPVENISQVSYSVPNFYTKINLLKHLLRTDSEMSKVLVFTGTKKLADDVFEHVEAEFGEVCGVIHSNKAQNHRFNTVEQFRNGTYRFIIATDIVARGIDVAEVSHVINFDLPEVPESYIHRIGRTGRADKKGIAISFVTPRDTEELEAIQDLMDYQIPVTDMPEVVEISTELRDDELPQVKMKEVLIKLPNINEGGGAFHEKLEKNKKVNVKVSHKDKMMAKYGKPKKRKPKKKK